MGQSESLTLRVNGHLDPRYAVTDMTNIDNFLSMLAVKRLNEAIQIASGIPPAKYGSIEVRPVRQLEIGGASG
jgi:hypothetical protein